MSFTIAGRFRIGQGEPVFTVAEAGINHNGSMDLAHQLVDVAADAKADAVKIQTINADGMLRSDTPKAPYQADLTGGDENQFEMLKRTELSISQHRELKAHCAERGILFMSTPFDFFAVDLLLELGVDVLKIPSGEINHLALLRHVGAAGHPVILSTGMSTLAEVEVGVKTLQAAGCADLALLHCVSCYPSDPADVNLRAMETMSRAFGVPVGLSDHTTGIAVSLASVGLGACVIEKHFTLDKQMAGPDHQASLEPDELASWISGIRAVESALGTGRKEPVAAEEGTRLVIRRSLHASQSIPEGSVIREGMIVALRPEGGIPPQLVDLVIGRTSTREISSGDCLQWDDLR